VSGFADKVERAFAARVARVIVVPEWDLELHVFPVTIGQISKINAEEDSLRRAARIIQVRGKNADGRPVLDDADFEAMCMKGIGPYGPQVVVRVAAEIMADFASANDAEAAEKN
jgi:hypothetical protein